MIWSSLNSGNILCYFSASHRETVRLGDHDLFIDTEAAHEDFAIARKIVHEGYNNNFENDIAILELDRDVVFKPSKFS